MNFFKKLQHCLNLEIYHRNTFKNNKIVQKTPLLQNINFGIRKKIFFHFKS